MSSTDIPRQITKIDHRYQIAGDPQLHLSECLLIHYPNDPIADEGIEGIRCTCLDYYPEGDTG